MWIQFLHVLVCLSWLQFGEAAIDLDFCSRGMYEFCAGAYLLVDIPIVDLAQEEACYTREFRRKEHTKKKFL